MTEQNKELLYKKIVVMSEEKGKLIQENEHLRNENEEIKKEIEDLKSKVESFENVSAIDMDAILELVEQLRKKLVNEIDEKVFSGGKSDTVSIAKQFVRMIQDKAKENNVDAKAIVSEITSRIK